VVFYATGPLAEFLDDLRGELEPGQPPPRSHVTVLPPRCLAAAPDDALQQLRDQSNEFRQFRAILGGIHSFEGTNVVYLSVATGFQDLHHMHRRLNQNALEFNEPYPYHPHITLAQGLAKERMPEALARARQRWDSYRGPRHFPCQSMYFVQGTSDLKWMDLAEVRLK
jgi:2'-5' RNA ligase